MPSRNPDYEAKVRHIFSAAPFIQHLGIVLTSLGEGVCVATLPVRPEHLQQDGFIHAGVLATLADHTAGAAAGSLVAADETILSVEFKVNLLRPAVGETALCRGSVLRHGRTLIVAEAEVFAVKDGVEKLVSKATVTLAVVSAAVGER